MTPAEIALVVQILQWAITEGKAVYDAMQLKAIADLQAKLEAQLTTTQQDRSTANTDIDNRDKALEAKLDGVK
jgi:hypothetical protein